MSVYRTIGPLVNLLILKFAKQGLLSKRFLKMFGSLDYCFLMTV